MKRIVLLITLLLTISVVYSQTEKAEKGRRIPSVDIKTMDGEPFNTASISNDGKPIILSFWALWCKPCIRELNTIADVYEEWVEEGRAIEKGGDL